jgi:membrane-bound serine protease (ClpP class)
MTAVLLALAGLSLAALSATARQDASQTVLSAELTGPIGPATTGFILRAIETAEAANAPALIVEMDTPGGLDASMRDINQAVLGSDVPVVVYVHPPGARAASAGAFITYASHIAAMAPGTSIGAATPVQMGGGGAEPPAAPEGTDPAVEEAASGEAAETTPDAAPAPGNAQAMRNKAVNDAVAYIRSLAELRGRNAEWAEAAVREAASVSAEEALELSVIEHVAATLPELLDAIDGTVVELQSGRTVTLETTGAGIEAIEKTFAQEVLAVITDPNIAFLLMNLGFIGLLVSFYNGLEPITAVAGVICLIVGLYALNTLPLNYAGAALILLGLALLVAEAFIASGGLLALGGLAAGCRRYGRSGRRKLPAPQLRARRPGAQGHDRRTGLDRSDRSRAGLGGVAGPCPCGWRALGSPLRRCARRR